MLKTFRRLFTRQKPLELEVYPASDRATPVVDPDQAPGDLLMNSGGELATATAPAPPSEAEQRLLEQIGRIEPLAETMIDRLERLGASEHELAAMVETFSRQSEVRERALLDTAKGLQGSTERQNQLLTALHAQIEQTGSANEALTGELRSFGADLQEITAQQQANARNGEELVVALREHTERFNEQMKLLAGVGIAMIILAALVLVAGVVLLVLSA